MKIIVNGGFERKKAEVVIAKNGQEIITLPKDAYGCDVDAEEGDTIDVKLKYTYRSVLPLATFAYRKGNDTYYVHPSAMYSKWMNATYKIPPFLCIILYAIQPLIQSEGYKWACIGMLVLTVVSFLGLQYSRTSPNVQGKLFKLDVL